MRSSFPIQTPFPLSTCPCSGKRGRKRVGVSGIAAKTAGGGSRAAPAVSPYVRRSCRGPMRRSHARVRREPRERRRGNRLEQCGMPSCVRHALKDRPLRGWGRRSPAARRGGRGRTGRTAGRAIRLAHTAHSPCRGRRQSDSMPEPEGCPRPFGEGPWPLLGGPLG